MTTFSIPLVESAKPGEHLETEAAALVDLLKGAFPNVEVGTPLGAGTAVEDSWSRSIKLVPAGSKGWVELDATWEKGATTATLEVSTGSRGKQMLGLAILLPVVVLAVMADQNPQWLPILRGLRVFLGALAGLLAGLAIFVPLGAVLKVGNVPEASELERQVSAALVRRYPESSS